MREDVKDLLEEGRMRIFICEFETHLELMMKSYEGGPLRSIAESCHGSAAIQEVLKDYRDLAKDLGLFE